MPHQSTGDIRGTRQTWYTVGTILIWAFKTINKAIREFYFTNQIIRLFSPGGQIYSLWTFWSECQREIIQIVHVMWVKFWSISSTCLIVALNVNSYKSILKSITDRAANLTIKDLLTFAMDQGEYSGNVYAQSCCVYRVYTYMYIHRRLNESYLIEQWTLAHYSSRERLI